MIHNLQGKLQQHCAVQLRVWFGKKIEHKSSGGTASEIPWRLASKVGMMGSDMMRFFKAVSTNVYWHSGCTGAVSLKKPHHIAIPYDLVRL